MTQATKVRARQAQRVFASLAPHAHTQTRVGLRSIYRLPTIRHRSTARSWARATYDSRPFAARHLLRHRSTEAL